MNNVKRALALLLSLCMVLSYVPVHGHAAEGATNVSMVVSAVEVKPEDTFTVTVSYGDMVVSSFTAGIKFDKTLLEVVSIVGGDPEYPEDFGLWMQGKRGETWVYATAVSSVADATKNGTVGFALAGTVDATYNAYDLFTVTFKAKAEGVAVFTLYEDTAGTDGYKNDNITTTTVTIGGSSEPECEHTSTKLVPNTDGTHNVVCEACEEPIQTNVTCSGTDDGDHTTAVMCACSNIVTAGTSHVDEAPKDHVCDVDGCEFAMGDHKSNAAYSCQDGTCDYCGEPVAAADNHTDSDDDDHDCDVCGAVNIEGHTEDTITEAVTEADCENAATFRDIVYCTECGETISTGEPYSSGDPLGHTWGTDIDYSWTGTTHCTATRTCETDENHKETVEAEVTSKVTTEGNCQTAEVVTYTATFDVDWAETQTNPVTGEKNPDVHYGDGKLGYYKDNGDGTHSFICGPCGQPTGETGSHDKAGQVYHSGNCRVPETVGCSKCSAVIEYSTNPDVHAGNGTTCVDNGDGATHTVKWSCCGAVINEAEPHNYVDGICSCNAVEHVCADNLDHVAAQDATCIETGIVEHWYCEHCDKYYSDDQATTEIDEDDTIAPVNPDNHVGGVSFVYENVTANTHDKITVCSDCNKRTATDIEPHDYTTGTSAHTCACEAVEKFTVTWTVNGEKYDETTFEYGAAVEAPVYVVSEGYTFSGWDVPATMPAEDITINATLTVNSYTVTWTVNDEKYDETTFEYGAAVEAPVYVVSEGYTFSGWEVPATMPAEDITINATLTVNSYTVTWTVNSEKYDETTFEYGAAVEAPVYVVSEGYTFSGWDVPATMPAKNLTIDATLTVNEYTLTVNVLATDDFDDSVDLTVPYGENLLDVLAKAAADGKIPAIGAEFLANDESENGKRIVCGYSYFDEESDGWIDIDEGMTMPASDFYVEQDYNRFGWMFSDIGDGIMGAEYYDFEDGWLGSGWHYIEENFDGVDGGAWYYFAEGTGEWAGWFFRVEGLTRVPYPTETINGNTYTPDAETLEYCANKGIEFIDADEAWFLFDEDGKFQSGFTGLEWIPGEEGASWVVKGMIPWHYGMVEGEDEYYYFIGNEEKGGNMLATGDVYVQRNNTDRAFVIGGIYTFDIYGVLCEYDGIIDMDNGTKRYYEDAQLMAGNGLTKVGDKFIYVRSNGELVVNNEYYVPTNDKGVVPGTYAFDENGYLIEPEMTGKDGIYWENGAWYYYENGVIGYNKGLIEVTEIWYDGEGTYETTGIIYVRSNGQLAMGYYYVTNMVNYNGSVEIVSGTKLLFDNYGMMVAPKNGIVDGYYYENDKIAYNAGVVEVEDGKYIYVRSNGEVVMGKNYWITNVGDTGVVAKLYTFDENGFFTPEFAEGAKEGIVDVDGVLYYYENGAIAYGKGLVKLTDENGVDFYIYVRSNGQLATGIYWPTTTNGYDFSGRYDFGTDGKLYI